MKNILLTFLLFISFRSSTQSLSYPSSFISTFKQNKLDQKYELKSYLKPAFLQADFNGDGAVDVAALIIEKKTKKKGILLITGKTNQYFVFGAGNKFGNGGDDFKWGGGWKIFKDKIAYEMLFNKDGDMTGGKKLKLDKPAIYIFDLEDGQPNSGGIIYWTGTKYVWIHQGE